MRILSSIVLAAAILSPVSFAGLRAETRPESTDRHVALTLKEELEKGLKARRPQEFAFIGRVVDMVNQGSLPRGLVRSTFAWARKKRPYPYPYFERALKIRAAKIGIVVQ